MQSVVPPVDVRTSVVVCLGGAEGCLHVRVLPDKWPQLQNDIKCAMAKQDDGDQVVDMYPSGTFVAARHKTDNDWHRGRVIESTATTVTVAFIDLGDQCRLPIAQAIRPLPPGLARHPRALAVKSKLKDVGPYDPKTWEAVTSFVAEMKPDQAMFGPAAADGVYPIQLYANQGKDDVNAMLAKFFLVGSHLRANSPPVVANEQIQLDSDRMDNLLRNWSRPRTSNLDHSLGRTVKSSNHPLGSPSPFHYRFPWLVGAEPADNGIPLSACRFQSPTQRISSQPHDVVVLSVAGPDMFFLRLKSDGKLLSEMNGLCGQGVTDRLPLPVAAGRRCAVFIDWLDTYVRATVVGDTQEANEKVQVYVCDYGYDVQIEPKHVYVLPEDSTLNTTPPLALPCCMAQVNTNAQYDLRKLKDEMQRCVAVFENKEVTSGKFVVQLLFQNDVGQSLNAFLNKGHLGTSTDTETKRVRSKIDLDRILFMIRKSLPKDCREDSVRIACVDVSLQLIFVQLEKEVQLIETIDTVLNFEKPVALEEVREGLLCAAKYQDCFFRAKIVSIRDDGFCLVYFVDWGNCDLVSVSDLSALPLKCQSPKDGAVAVRLFGVEENDFERNGLRMLGQIGWHNVSMQTVQQDGDGIWCVSVALLDENGDVHDAGSLLHWAEMEKSD